MTLASQVIIIFVFFKKGLTPASQVLIIFFFENGLTPASQVLNTLFGIDINPASLSSFHHFCLLELFNFETGLTLAALVFS